MNWFYIIIGCVAMFTLGFLVGAMMANAKDAPEPRWEERHDEYPPIY